MTAGVVAAGRQGTRASRPALGLLLSGLAVLAFWATLVWSAVFGNDQTEQPCGGPHRDVFFPPATICTPVGHPDYSVTSSVATVAGSVLFALGAGLALAGAVLLLLSRLRALRG